MATAISLSFSLDPQFYHHHHFHQNSNFNSHKVSIFTQKSTHHFHQNSTFNSHKVSIFAQKSTHHFHQNPTFKSHKVPIFTQKSTHHFHQNPTFNSHKVSIFTQKSTYPFLISSKSHTSHHHFHQHPSLNAHKVTIFTQKSHTSNLIIPLSTSQSSSSTSSSPTSESSFLQTPLQPGGFLTEQDLEKLETLEKYRYFQELGSGWLYVRVMKEDEMDVTVWLLAESFAESMLMPKGYVKYLAFFVKQYMIERRTMMPHTATLLGFYKEKKGEEDDVDEDLKLAGTVEVCFDKRGANANPPTPIPPKNSPYICNMTVEKLLRRRGIGWHLLKAGEELISQMSSSREVYLHCRMIDTAPLNMYRKAGYTIVGTDNIFILLTLQRRKHLMCKVLPETRSPFEDDQSTSSIDT